MSSLLFASVLVIPAVIEHEQALLRESVVEICEQRVELDQKPCAVVDVDGKTCFAYMAFDGTSSTVHCFPLESDQ